MHRLVALVSPILKWPGLKTPSPHAGLAEELDVDCEQVVITQACPRTNAYGNAGQPAHGPSAVARAPPQGRATARAMLVSAQRSMTYRPTNAITETFWVIP